MMMKKQARICLVVSCALMAVALLLSFFGLGVNYGIDFAGGLSMKYAMGGEYDKNVVSDILAKLNVGDFSIAEQGGYEINVRINTLDEEAVQNVQSALEEALFAAYPAAARVGDTNYVGPVAGQTLLLNAVYSVALASVLMLLYIAFRFDLNSGIAAVLGLIHDVLMMLTFMVLLRSFVQMNSSFIAAMLTIVGYSINNTIVIFDRIRENSKKMPNASRVEVVDRSVKECRGRTLNTTATTLVTMVALYVLGVDSIREFALPIIIGIVSGVYSANMINGYIWAALEEKKRARKAA